MPKFLFLLILDGRLRKQRLATALLLFILIVALGSIPGARAEVGRFGAGWLMHCVAYGSLTFLMYTGLQGSRNERALKAVLTVMLMGALDELVQSLLPYRVGGVIDWMIDASAALFTAGLLRTFLPEPVTSVRA